MTKEESSDNKDTQVEADNKAEVKETNFPNDEAQVEEKQVEQPQDPELTKWIEETGSLENAYQRVKGSQSEVEKLREEAEKTAKEKADFEAQIAHELQQVYQKDPDTASKLFGMEIPTKEEKQENPSLDANQIAAQAAKQAQAKIEVDTFHEKNSHLIKDDGDWQAIQDVALSFVGKTDSENKPYTIKSALKDALLLRHKELIGDDAVMKHLSAEANRVSATEQGDVTGGSSAEVELTEEEISMAKQMGVDIEKWKKRKQQQLQS